MKNNKKKLKSLLYTILGVFTTTTLMAQTIETDFNSHSQRYNSDECTNFQEIGGNSAKITSIDNLLMSNGYNQSWVISKTMIYKWETIDNESLFQKDLVISDKYSDPCFNKNTLTKNNLLLHEVEDKNILIGNGSLNLFGETIQNMVKTMRVSKIFENEKYSTYVIDHAWYRKNDETPYFIIKENYHVTKIGLRLITYKYYQPSSKDELIKVVTVTPNPVKNLITISFNYEKYKSGNCMLRITDVDGRIKYEKVLDNIETPIQADVSNYRNGVYQVTLIDHDRIVGFSQIIKQ